MKHLIWSLTFISSVAGASSANLSDFLHKAPCSTQVSQEIDAEMRRQTWAPIVVAEKMQPLAYGTEFRDTRKNKAYKLYSRGNDSFYSVMTIGETKQSLTTWSKGNACKKTTTTTDVVQAPVPAKGFADKDLKAALKAHKQGLIYVWSPHMPLSVEGLQEIKDAAKKLNMHLTILQDGKANPQGTAKWVKTKRVLASETTPVASRELYARQVQLHYPVLFIYKDGFLSNRTIVGHKKADTFEKWISTEVAQLQKDLQ